MKQFQAHIISETAPLTEALSQINTLSGSVMTLLVVDSEGRMTGTLTDGDVRRALINGAGLNDQVCQAMKRDFRSLPPDASVNEIRNLRRMGLRLLPVIDSDRRIISVLDLQRQHTLLPVRAVLMAGGRGERLRPLTDTVPKPLLKVGDQCI
ncbi:MAG: CBS domain-containing protein, partial [Muribaculaceae bacterium]|nr:CBS domain-containing protein [Muribaculaceae bacterium]